MDEKRNPKTRATVAQLVEKYLDVAELDLRLVAGIDRKYEHHLKPLIGAVPLGWLFIAALITADL